MSENILRKKPATFYLAVLLLLLSGLSYSATQDLSPQSIRHYYNFDTSGDINANMSNSVGSLIGATVVAGAGHDAGGLVFSRESDVLTLSGIDLGGLSQFSIAAWVKPNSFSGSSAEGRVVTKATGFKADQHNWMIGLGGDGSAVRFRVKTSDGGTSTLSTLQGQLAKNVWTHVAGVYTGSKMEIYVNGVLNASKRKTGLVVDSAELDASIGNQLPHLERRAFAGVIDDLAIFNNAITSEFLQKVISGESEIKLDTQSETTTQEIVAYGDLMLPTGDAESVAWGPSVSLIGADTSGDKAPVVFGWNGYSVSTSRNRLQIDYDGASQNSEKLYIVFDDPASSIFLHLRFFESSEWRGLPETGAWVAYNANGEILAEGELSAKQPSSETFPSLKRGVKSFSIDVNGVSYLKIFPTGYGNGQGAKTTGNNSDFNIHGMNYITATQSISLRGSVASVDNIESQTPESQIVDNEAVDVVVPSNDESTVSSDLVLPKETLSSSDSQVQLAVHSNLPLGGSFYGNYEYGFHTGNAKIGGESSRRFRSEKSGEITAVRYNNRTLSDVTIQSRCKSTNPNSVWCKCVKAGLDAYSCGYTLGNSYSVGNGGSIVVEVRNDDDGLPGSTVLGRTSGVFIPQKNRKIHYPILQLEQPVALVAGQTYHLVFKNLNPPVNCRLSGVAVEDAAGCPRNAGAIGLNGISFAENSTFGQIGLDPFRGKSAANFFRVNSNKPWILDSDNLSWYEVLYADGSWVGDSYTAYGSTGEGQHEIAGAYHARQIFTVSDADRTVDGVWLNFGHSFVRKASGASLSATLKNEQGTVIATGNIKSSEECAQKAVQGKSSGDRDAKHCRAWGHTEFDSPVVLRVGSRYSLEFSADAGAGFLLSASFPLSYGAWNSESRNHWNDARAELSKNGGRTWSSWASKHTGRDLSVLFTLQGGPRYLQ